MSRSLCLTPPGTTLRGRARALCAVHGLVADAATGCRGRDPDRARGRRLIETLKRVAEQAAPRRREKPKTPSKSNGLRSREQVASIHELPRRLILRTSPFGHSRKFAESDIGKVCKKLKSFKTSSFRGYACPVEEYDVIVTWSTDSRVRAQDRYLPTS